MQYRLSARSKAATRFFPALFAAAFLWSGCSAPATERDTLESPPQTLETHIVRSNDLRFLMRSMDEVIHEEPQKSELEYEDAKRRYALRLAGTIREIASEIEKFPVENGMLKSPGDAARFKGYAAELYKNGERIRALATAYEMETLEPAMNDMVRTCNACHRHFNAQATSIERGR